MSGVKVTAGSSRISSKNQITIPVAVLRQAGLSPGDRLRTVEASPGRIVLELDHDPLEPFVGSLTGVYSPNELDDLRNEWD
jgi:bifunctional DNA-binding transcriptional regulator/antitoxin component of YhaV-PrlF toxin-antitoxin module